MAAVPMIADIIQNAQNLVGQQVLQKMEVNGKQVEGDTTLYELFVYLKCVEEEDGKVAEVRVV